MTSFLKFSSFFLAVLLLVSCQDDDNDIVIDVPTTYAFTRTGQNTVDFSGQTTRIAMANELNDALLDFDQTAESLSDMFRNPEGSNAFSTAELNASEKSIRTKVAASRDLFFTNATEQASIRSDFDGWLNAQVQEVFPNQNNLAAPGTAGQIADAGATRYVNANGLEYNEAVIKGLIGALMYDQIVNNYLSPSVLDEGANRADNDAAVLVNGQPYTQMEHHWDEAYGYLFGTSADAARPLEDLGRVDAFMNKYLRRMENDPDYTGIAATIEQAFRTGRAAIVAGDYAERDRQADIITENLQKVLAVRAVYYLVQGERGLTATPPAYGTAFHDLSEGYGFIYSLRFVAGQDAGTVDNWLETLANEGNGGFWTLPPAALSTMATEIANAYNLNLAEAGN